MAKIEERVEIEDGKLKYITGNTELVQEQDLRDVLFVEDRNNSLVFLTTAELFQHVFPNCGEIIEESRKILKENNFIKVDACIHYWFNVNLFRELGLILYLDRDSILCFKDFGFFDYRFITSDAIEIVKKFIQQLFEVGIYIHCIEDNIIICEDTIYKDLYNFWKKTQQKYIMEFPGEYLRIMVNHNI